MVPYMYKVSPSQAAVLIFNVMKSEHAANDADRTVDELLRELDECKGYLKKGVLESALYCCNMEAEEEKFWHPQGHSFDKFISELLTKPLMFHKYYNVIIVEKKKREDGTEEKS